MLKNSYLKMITRTIPGRITLVVDIFSLSNIILGHIQWYSPWRRYCFYPADDSLYDARCMVEIVDKINELLVARKQ